MKRNLVKNLCVLSLCAGMIGAAGCGTQTAGSVSEESSNMSGEYQEPAGNQELSGDPESSGDQKDSTVPETSEEQKTPEVQETQDENIFAKLPSQFTFSSGAGAWATTFELSPDGTFTGQYQDSDMGDAGPGYENGTVYISQFSGKFTEPQKVDDYSYTMKLDHLDVQGTAGEEYIEDNVRYIYSEAYGFDDADTFMIYLPGCPLKDLPEEFLSWTFIDRETCQTMPDGMFGIYNQGGQEGFIGMDDNGQ